ncbi:MAG: hypothetical protein Q3979_06065 [Actinomycetaceae bacterium]|nr:hypothetical protein [Actinomycetaceae bacterium]
MKKNSGRASGGQKSAAVVSDGTSAIRIELGCQALLRRRLTGL